MPYTVFADSNVFLDALLNRVPANKDCWRILDLAEKREITLYTSSSLLLTTIYFLQKSGMPGTVVISVIEQLLRFTLLISPDENTVRVGLHAGFSDLEDAVQYYTAVQKGIDYFITSNTKDFKKASAPLPVFTPRQFAQLYHKKPDHKL